MVMSLHPRTLAYVAWDIFGEVTFLEKDDVD